MDVIFTRTGTRTRLLCRRANGTFTSADLGPGVPSHDFAHLIVERALRLASGFFINIANGYSIQQLSEATTIHSLGPDPYVAEILARALGSLATGACTMEQFPDLVRVELEQMRLPVPQGLTAEATARMLTELRTLLERFGNLAPGEVLKLRFG